MKKTLQKKARDKPMKGKWAVVTPTGTVVYEGDKRACKAYIKQALAKGSAEDYLRIVAASSV